MVCHHVVTRALLDTGGAKAVLPQRVDVHLVGGGVVEHERRACVLAGGLVTEPAANQAVALPRPRAASGALVVAAVTGRPAAAAPGALLGTDDFGH